jgi:hypothetical protein
MVNQPARVKLNTESVRSRALGTRLQARQSKERKLMSGMARNESPFFS